MPFKDTKEGETHSYNDGCGEPAHNSKLPKEIEERFDKEFPLIRETGIEEAEGVFFSKNDRDRVKSFIATILNEETKKSVENIWKDYTVIIPQSPHNIEVCGLCNNTGRIKNPYANGKPCLCPNGLPLHTHSKDEIKNN